MDLERVRHDSPRHSYPHSARSGQGAPQRTHSRNPAPDWTLAARRNRSEPARGAHHLDRLRCDPGRRWNSHRLHYRRLRRAWPRARKLVEAGTLTSVPLKDFVAAVSVGIVDGEILLDLCYEEDSRADVDMNFVMTAGYKMVEVQATAEHQVFDDQQLAKMIAFAKQGVQSLIAKQQAVLKTLTLRQ